LPPVILCVDDDPNALFVRRLLLSIAGYAVLTAGSVEAAQDLFACNRVDLMITDHLLPDGTGAELMLQMKQVQPKALVALLTAWAETPQGYKHADRLLNKGMTPDDFLTEVASLLSNHKDDPKAFSDTNSSTGDHFSER
jgi:DNA-binding response OmpR family regulator